MNSHEEKKKDPDVKQHLLFAIVNNATAGFCFLLVSSFMPKNVKGKEIPGFLFVLDLDFHQAMSDRVDLWEI